MKYRRGGIDNPTLTVVEATAQARGRVVGVCEHGSKKIVYTRQPEPMLTECKDGSVSAGGNCGSK